MGLRPAGLRPLLLAALVATVGATSCGGPDRSAEAERLEEVVGELPGVSRIHVRYSDDLTQGHDLHLDLDVTTADPGQIERVARTVEEVAGDDFRRFDRSTRFVVAPGVVLHRHGRLDPAAVAKDVRGVRAVVGEIPGLGVHWRRHEDGSPPATVHITPSPNSVAPDGSPKADVPADSAVVLASARTHLSEDGVVVTIDQETGPQWTVMMPLDEDRQRAVAATMAEIPLAVTALSVEQGHASRVRVRLRDRGAADSDLRTVIAAFGSGTEHPLMLVWEDAVDTPRDTPGFAGSVHLGGCGYGSTLGEADPERFYTPEAVELRLRLRQEFDTCG